MSTFTLLEKKNPHHRDLNITFEPIEHKYTIGGSAPTTNGIVGPGVYATMYNDDRVMSHREEATTPPYISVTTWLNSHFEHFDADAIITRMMAGKNWSSSQYYGKTREEIKAGWDRTRDEAARLGTEMHEAIECYYNGGYQPGWNPHFLNYVKKHASDFVPYRTEWMVYDEEVRIAGSIDMVYEDPAGDGDGKTLMIYDWKRAKEIKKTASFGKYSTTECISHLPDTNFWHYALQLNMYRAILERNYGKKVTKLMLVCLHPDNKNGDYLLFKVPMLDDEIHELFDLRKKQLLFR